MVDHVTKNDNFSPPRLTRLSLNYPPPNPNPEPPPTTTTAPPQPSPLESATHQP